MENVMEDMRATQEQLADAQALVQQKERALLEKEAKLGLVNQQVINHVLVNNVNSHVNSSSLNTATVKENLIKLWATLNTSPEEKITMLLSLFDCVQGPVSADDGTPTALCPAFINKYLEIEAKLTARMPINKLLAHKQLLEFKLKNAQALANNTANTTEYEANAKVVAILTQELVDLVQLLNASIRAYEEEHKESYFFASPGVTINEENNTTHTFAAEGASPGGKLSFSPGGRRPQAAGGAQMSKTGRNTMSPTGSGAAVGGGNGGSNRLGASAPLNGNRLFNKQ